MSKIIQVGKALEILWGNYKLYCEKNRMKPDFADFMDWIGSIQGYAGYPLEGEIEEIREFDNETTT